MARKRYSVEQIVAKLREAEKLEAQGLTVAQRCKRLGISDQTFFRWRIKYGALKEDEAQRAAGARAGEQPAEADRGRAGAGHFDAGGVESGKLVSPVRRRAAVAHLMHRFPVSERRACQVVGQHRSTQRYLIRPPEFELRLVRRMNELADRHPRYGYRRVWALLRQEGWAVNRKRVERLWRLEGHRVPPQRKSHGKKADGSIARAVWNTPAMRPDHVWSYDFVSTVTADGAPLRILNVVDEYTRRALVSHVDRHIGSRDVVAVLDRLFRARGRPEFVRSDNGREFIAESTRAWLAARHVKPIFIEKGSPQQNPYVERFNGTMRDEVLNGEHFDSVLEARVVIAAWVREYNTLRPHRGLGCKTPQAFYEGSRVVSR